MSIARALAGLPDDTVLSVVVSVTVRELREAFAVPSHFRVITTVQAAGLLGYSCDTWRGWAEADQIHGAYRDDGEAGSWRLPFHACEEHLARLLEDTPPPKPTRSARISRVLPMRAGQPRVICGGSSGTAPSAKWHRALPLRGLR